MHRENTLWEISQEGFEQAENVTSFHKFHTQGRNFGIKSGVTVRKLSRYLFPDGFE